ncbi:MAG: DUF1307 domain-containing protein [Streptococcus sp.]|nr:DUF1307 domain-containing protein [Streptococcus sp.]
MKSKKNLLKLFAYSITSIVIIFTLSACSFGHKKAYYQLIFEEEGIDNRMTVEADFDKISSVKSEALIFFNDSNLDDSTKQSIKTEFETRLNKSKNSKCATAKISQTDDYTKYEITLDFSKLDPKERNLLPLLLSDKYKAYLNLKTFADEMKKRGYSEVKDGKFKELK